MPKKLLIIRFSSFGDIIHCRSILKPLCETSTNSYKVSWLVRADLKGALEAEKNLSEAIPFERKQGLLGLIKLALKLRSQKFDVLYDAHNNLRSTIVRWIVGFMGPKVIVRPKDRLKRFLLFKLGVNKFPQPFRGMVSYWKPLEKALSLKGELSPIEWPVSPDKKELDLLQDSIVLVPATAWPMKSWPVENWKKLITLLPDEKFIVLGGPQDDFCEEIAAVAPERVQNWAGKYSLKESCSHAAHARFLITADTGLQQVADLSGVKGLSLIGPTAFGFPTMGTLKVLEIDLPCRPCTKDGRGKCSRAIYQECLVSLTPEIVVQEFKSESKTL
jgi:heptosyltransferase-2